MIRENIKLTEIVPFLALCVGSSGLFVGSGGLLVGSGGLLVGSGGLLVGSGGLLVGSGSFMIDLLGSRPPWVLPVTIGAPSGVVSATPPSCEVSVVVSFTAAAVVCGSLDSLSLVSVYISMGSVLHSSPV